MCLWEQVWVFLGHTHRFHSMTKELMVHEKLRTISLCNRGPNGSGGFAQSDFLESNHQPWDSMKEMIHHSECMTFWKQGGRNVGLRTVPWSLIAWTNCLSWPLGKHWVLWGFLFLFSSFLPFSIYKMRWWPHLLWMLTCEVARNHPEKRLACGHQ